MTERFLVTGGGGFIGSHVVEALLRDGRAVTVLDNFSTGRRANLDVVVEELHAAPGRRAPDVSIPDLRIIEGSVTDPAAVAEAFEAVRGVVHLAALPSVVRSVEAPLESHDHNVTGTVQVLDRARQTGARVVYAGSSSAYGDQDEPRKHEELRERPLSPYAASKLAGELYCRVFGQCYGQTIVVTRFFNVFGPRQVPDSPYSGVVAAFCFALLQRRGPRIDGDGSQTRDFTFVGDVARGLLAALDRDLPPGCHTVNLAGGGNISVLDLLRGLQAAAGIEVEPEFGPPRAGDVRHSQADVSKLSELLGFRCEVTFAEGLRQTYDWYRSVYA